MFHVTRRSAVQSIMKYGLRPYKVRHGRDARYPASVWLYNTQERAVQSLSRGRTILIVRADLLNLDDHLMEHVGGGIFRYEGRIAPQMVNPVN